MTASKLQLSWMPDRRAQETMSADRVHPHVGKRLDVFLAVELQRSRNHIQSLLKKGLVEMQPPSAKAEASYRLRKGDSVTINVAPESAEHEIEKGPAGEDIPLDVIYEDEAVLAINKQPGLVVHPAAGHRTGTLVNALIHHCGTRLAQRGGAERLGIVHRLDKDTSGVLLVAKTELAHERIAAAFAERRVRKSYLTLAWGKFRNKSGELRAAIGRHRIHRQKMTVLKTGGRASHTDYRVVIQGTHGAEVECLLHTGRTHQIRVHLAHLGNPVWGDLIYGRAHVLPDTYAPPRQMLHAARLEIVHPLTGKPLQLEARPPDDYQKSRRRLLEMQD